MIEHPCLSCCCCLLHHISIFCEFNATVFKGEAYPCQLRKETNGNRVCTKESDARYYEHMISIAVMHKIES